MGSIDVCVCVCVLYYSGNKFRWYRCAILRAEKSFNEITWTHRRPNDSLKRTTIGKIDHQILFNVSSQAWRPGFDFSEFRHSIFCSLSLSVVFVSTSFNNHSVIQWFDSIRFCVVVISFFFVFCTHELLNVPQICQCQCKPHINNLINFRIERSTIEGMQKIENAFVSIGIRNAHALQSAQSRLMMTMSYGSLVESTITSICVRDRECVWSRHTDWKCLFSDAATISRNGPCHCK